MSVLLTEQGRELGLRARDAHHRHAAELFARPLYDGDIHAVYEAFSKIRVALTDERADLSSNQRTRT